MKNFIKDLIKKFINGVISLRDYNFYLPLFFTKFIQYHFNTCYAKAICCLFLYYYNYFSVIQYAIYNIFSWKFLFFVFMTLYDNFLGNSFILEPLLFLTLWLMFLLFILIYFVICVIIFDVIPPLFLFLNWLLLRLGDFSFDFLIFFNYIKGIFYSCFIGIKYIIFSPLIFYNSYFFLDIAEYNIFIVYNFYFFLFVFFLFVFWVTKLRLITYFIFLLTLVGGVYILCIYNSSILWYQFILKLYALKTLQISYIIGVDNISIYFVILCIFLVTVCYLMYWFLTYNIYLYSLCLIATLFLLINIFIVLDFFLLFIFFEGIIIPMMFLINFWGSRFRKIHASNLLVLFTLYGSIFMLISFLSIYSSKGSSSFFYFWQVFLFNDKQLILWIFLFIGFAVKIPVIPLHIWLPEAHVEAPTPGSVILAGVLLKLGTYAMARLLLSFINVVIDDVLCFVWILACLGFNLASIIALNQQDMKKIIAYSSIAHINFSLFGFFGDNILGLSGMFFFMLGHAITSSALFIGIGVLYDRYKTRYLFYYGALAMLMPVFSSMYFINILSNFAFPGTFNFVGEILVISSIFKNSNFILALSIFPMILSLIYSFFFFSRVFFGTLSAWFIRYYCDCIRLEFVIFSFFVFLVLIFGINPMLLKTLLFF
jgi:proton-translocating NADH-quinone oxidoreductase chain M